MPKPVYLVGCSNTKRAGPCAAKDLYTGDLFRKARAYVERLGNPWFILSSRYGLVSPDQPIDYYDEYLAQRPTWRQRAWGSEVRVALEAAGLGDANFVILAGGVYRRAIGLRPDQFTAPLAGLGIGEQLAALKAVAETGYLDPWHRLNERNLRPGDVVIAEISSGCEPGEYRVTTGPLGKRLLVGVNETHQLQHVCMTDGTLAGFMAKPA